MRKHCHWHQYHSLLRGHVGLLRRTHPIAQATGIPAAGQGDSGGPTYVASSGIYAAGFISGLLGATTTCTGDAGGRLCSATVLFAGVAYPFAAGYALNVIP